MTQLLPRILITPGEPAGIGPDVILQLAHHSFLAELVVICDADMLAARAKELNINVKFIPCDLTHDPALFTPGTLKIKHIPLSAPCIPGKLNPLNSPYVIDCLALATDLCLQKKASALVTGPINKSAIHLAGIPFTGHTEFLAERCNAEKVLMLFVVDKLRIALATTHIPLAAVSSAITVSTLIQTVRLLHRELQNRFHIPAPNIFMAGLNPHAGEEGLLGHEEIDTLIPAIHQLRTENINIHGPFPADTLFTKTRMAQCDAMLAMYHDQALPVVKYLGFDRAVNMTLGLPIIRTSVDHGTALDLAGTGKSDPGSLLAAIQLAINLR